MTAPGRPTKYDSKFHPFVAAFLARWGKTNVEIAKELNIGEKTLYRWQEEYPKFAKALKENKLLTDQAVENMLLKKAMGFEYEETHITIDKKGDAEYKTIKKQALPDHPAISLWLRNRRPDLWRDKQEVSLDGDLTLIVGNDFLPEKNKDGIKEKEDYEKFLELKAKYET